MVSAFLPAQKAPRQGVPRSIEVVIDLPGKEARHESETEDEEVKLNCASGVCVLEDSDMSDSDTECEEDESSVSDDEMEPCNRPVSFRKVRVKQSLLIRCPKALRASPLSETARSSTQSLSSFSESESLTSTTSETSGSDADESGSESDDESDDDDSVADSENDREPVEDDAQSDDESLVEESSQRSEASAAPSNSDLESLIGDEEEETADQGHVSMVFDRSISRNMPLLGPSIPEEHPQETGMQTDSERSVSKRTLSTDNLMELICQHPDSHKSPKRQRCEETATPILVLPEITLGPSAYPANVASISPCSSSDRGDDERMLGEELLQTSFVDSFNKPKTPVPLLTPPGSPLLVQSSEGPTTVCEWPSNLTVDTALYSAIHMLPPSPSQLEELVHDFEGSPAKDSSTLTPLIRGMKVELQ